MIETTLEVQVPIPLLRFGFDRNEIQSRITEWLVLSLFTESRISSGKAARLLNLSRIEFLSLLRARGIAYINYTPDELADEFSALETLEIKPLKCLCQQGFSLSQYVINEILQKANE